MNVALVLVGVSIALFALEIGLRLWFKIRAQTAPENTYLKSWLAPDEDLGYRLNPEYEQFSNSGSQRNLTGVEADEYRILILGDSVAFNGEEFADTIAGRAEKLLEQTTDLVPIKFLNSSTPGYTNYQELLWLKKFGLSFKPKLVGVVFVMNDLFRFLHTIRTKQGEPFAAGELASTSEAGEGIRSWPHQLLRRSVFLTVLSQRFQIVRNALSRWEANGFAFDYRSDFYSAWQDEPWRMIEEQMREMVNLGDQHGFRVFLIAIPFGDQLRPDYLAKDEAYVKKPQRKLHEICRLLDIPFLDLFDDLSLGTDFRSDRIHLTKEGRAVAASQIAAFLLTEKLIPTRYVEDQQLSIKLATASPP